MGHRGEISAALEFNQASLARLPKKMPWTKKKAQDAVPWAYRYAFPRLRRANLTATKVVHGGKTRATKWHEVQFN